jgi:hypothetical protein
MADFGTTGTGLFPLQPDNSRAVISAIPDCIRNRSFGTENTSFPIFAASAVPVGWRSPLSGRITCRGRGRGYFNAGIVGFYLGHHLTKLYFQFLQELLLLILLVFYQSQLVFPLTSEFWTDKKWRLNEIDQVDTCLCSNKVLAIAYNISSFE